MQDNVSKQKVFAVFFHGKFLNNQLVTISYVHVSEGYFVDRILSLSDSIFSVCKDMLRAINIKNIFK